MGFGLLFLLALLPTVVSSTHGTIATSNTQQPRSIVLSSFAHRIVGPDSYGTRAGSRPEELTARATSHPVLAVKWTNAWLLSFCTIVAGLPLVRWCSQRRSNPLAAVLTGGRGTPFEGPRHATGLATLQSSFQSEAPAPVPLRQPKSAIGWNLQTLLDEGPLRDLMQKETARLCLKGPPVEESERRLSVEDMLYFGAENALRRAGLPLTGARGLSMARGAGLGGGISGSLSSLLSHEEQQVAEDHAGALDKLVTGGGLPLGTPLKMFKFELFQLYRASLNFGYYLRYMSRRLAAAHAIAKLDGEGESQGTDPSTDVSRMSVVTFFNTFAGDPVMEFLRCGSLEAARVFDDVLRAGFGDPDRYLTLLRDVVGQVTTLAEYRGRVQAAMEFPPIPDMELLDTTVGDMRGVVLEAVAFGACLQETEVFLESAADCPLLHRMLPL